MRMGFNTAEAAEALRRCNGHVDDAAADLTRSEAAAAAAPQAEGAQTIKTRAQTIKRKVGVGMWVCGYVGGKEAGWRSKSGRRAGSVPPPLEPPALRAPVR